MGCLPLGGGSERATVAQLREIGGRRRWSHVKLAGFACAQWRVSFGLGLTCKFKTVRHATDRVRARARASFRRLLVTGRPQAEGERSRDRLDWSGGMCARGRGVCEGFCGAAHAHTSCKQ